MNGIKENGAESMGVLGDLWLGRITGERLLHVDHAFGQRFLNAIHQLLIAGAIVVTLALNYSTLTWSTLSITYIGNRGQRKNVENFHRRRILDGKNILNRFNGRSAFLLIQLGCPPQFNFEIWQIVFRQSQLLLFLPKISQMSK